MCVCVCVCVRVNHRLPLLVCSFTVLAQYTQGRSKERALGRQRNNQKYGDSTHVNTSDIISPKTIRSLGTRIDELPLSPVLG